MIYYACMNDAPVSDLFRQAIMKTENQLMELSDCGWQDCPDTVRRSGAYIIFYQGGGFTMAHMFQYQLLNKWQKVSTTKHAL